MAGAAAAVIGAATAGLGYAALAGGGAALFSAGDLAAAAGAGAVAGGVGAVGHAASQYYTEYNDEDDGWDEYDDYSNPRPELHGGASRYTDEELGQFAASHGGDGHHDQGQERPTADEAIDAIENGEYTENDGYDGQTTTYKYGRVTVRVNNRLPTKSTCFYPRGK